MLENRKLILAHFWLAFAAFGLALFLGAWQMFVRSPLLAWISNPEWYYRSLTAHKASRTPPLVLLSLCVPLSPAESLPRSRSLSLFLYLSPLLHRPWSTAPAGTARWEKSADEERNP